MKRTGTTQDPSTSPGSYLQDSHVTANTANSGGQKLSSGETSKNKRRQLSRLDLLKRKSIAVIVISDLILIGLLVAQLLQVSAVLHGLFATKVADTSEYVASGLSRDEDNMRLGMTKYAANYSSTPACMAIAGDPLEIHFLFLNERVNRQLEFLAITDLTGKIVSSAGPVHLNDVVFNPSGIITTYTEKFLDSGQQFSVAIPVGKELFAQMHAPEYRDNPDKTTLRTWNTEIPSFTRFVIQPLFCGKQQAQGFAIWGDAITAAKYSLLDDAVEMADSGFVAFMMYDEQQKTFVSSSSYLKSGNGVSFPDFHGIIPQSQLDLVVQTQQNDLIEEVAIEGVNYIYSINPVSNAKIGDTEVDVYRPRAVYIFGLPSTAIKATVVHLLKWHAALMAFVVAMSFITMWLLISKFVQPLHNLLESVKKKKISDFNKAIRVMKSNKLFILFFIAQLLIIEGLLGWLIYLNRQLLEDAVSEFSSASGEGPEISSLLSSRHHDIGFYLQGWAGFADIVNQTAAGNFSDHIVQQIRDTADFLHVSISIIARDSLIIESSDRSGLGQPFPIDSLIDYFSNETGDSRRAIVTTAFWSPVEVAHLIPIRNDSDNIPMEPAVVKIMAAPISSISESSDNNLVRGDVIGAIVAVDLVNDQPSLLASSMDVFHSGYFGMFAWNKAFRRFQLLGSLYKRSKSDTSQVNVLLNDNAHDVLSRGLSSSFSSKQLYVEDDIIIDSRPNTVAIVPLVPIHEPSFSECTLHAYIVRGIDDSQWLLMLDEQADFEAVIMAVEFATALIGLMLTFWPMNRFLNSMQKAFNVPSLSAKEREKMDSHAASIMGLDPAGKIQTKPQSQQSLAGNSTTNSNAI